MNLAVDPKYISTTVASCTPAMLNAARVRPYGMPSSASEGGESESTFPRFSIVRRCWQWPVIAPRPRCGIVVPSRVTGFFSKVAGRLRPSRAHVTGPGLLRSDLSFSFAIEFTPQVLDLVAQRQCSLLCVRGKFSTVALRIGPTRGDHHAEGHLCYSRRAGR